MSRCFSTLATCIAFAWMPAVAFAHSGHGTPASTSTEVVTHYVSDPLHLANYLIVAATVILVTRWQWHRAIV